MGDFAENYQFVVRDEIQSYHWAKTQYTLHPVALYYRDENNKLIQKSICFLSDDNDHDTCFVYEVQTQVIQHIQRHLSSIKRIEYFSDGCAGQYKNYKNFLNLCLHKQDFGLDAVWSFFATSHGKSPCDGIGGAVKRVVVTRSLKRPINDQILSYRKMLELFCNEIKSVTYYGIDMGRMLEVRCYLKPRFFFFLIFFNHSSR